MSPRERVAQAAAWQAELDREGRVELRSSRPRLAVLLLLAVLLTAAGVVVLPGATDLRLLVGGIAAIAFFGVLGIPVLAWRLVGGGSTVVVTRDAIELVRGFRIAWSDVRGVALAQVGRARIVLVRARDEATQRRALVARRSAVLLGLSNGITRGTDLALPNDLAGDREALARWLAGLVPEERRG